ncbi:MAG: DUF6134 family protein [Pseudomonadota bacterium]
MAPVFGALLSMASPVAARPQIERPAALSFDILRNDAVIGRHTLRFTEDGDRLIVEIVIRIKVTFASIPVYRYEHDSREVWSDGQLVGLETRTNDDGEAFHVSARREADHLLVDGSSGRLELPADVMPTSYWNQAMLKASRFLDTQRGKLCDLQIGPPQPETVEVDGLPQPTSRQAVSGDLAMELWYLPNGEWAKLVFAAKGTPIVYVRRKPDPAGP